MEMLPVLFNALALLSVLGRTGARTSSPNTTPSGPGPSTSDLRGQMITVSYSYSIGFTMYTDAIFPSPSPTIYPSPSTSPSSSPSSSSAYSPYPSPPSSSPSPTTSPSSSSAYSSPYTSPSTSPYSSSPSPTTYPSHSSTSPSPSPTTYPSPSPSSSPSPSPSPTTYPSHSPSSSPSPTTYPSPSPSSSPSPTTYPSPSPSSSPSPSPSPSPTTSPSPSPSPSPTTYPSHSPSPSSPYSFPSTSPSPSSPYFSPSSTPYPSHSPSTSPSPSSPYTTPSPSLSALTVCLRYMAEEGKDLTLFSLTQGNYWNLLLERNSGMDFLSIHSSSQSFRSYRLMWSIAGPRPWTSLCVTWEKNTGVAQVWRGGTVSVRKRVFGQVTNGPPVLKVYKFEGQVTDVEVWDRILSPRWIMSYMSGWQSYWSYTPGNVLTWSKAIYSTNGEVLLERNTYNSDHQPIRGQRQLPRPMRRKKMRKCEWKKRARAEQIARTRP
ncbi:mucin-1-like [Salvelinus alpinus]|uniref:mucin-1-like n=1 Tax=Salvelinus alpinus TaxID=8036 RepID=UPI0039FD8AC6